MRIFFLILSIASISIANSMHDDCTPIYDSDDGSVMNSHCANKQIELKQKKRAPAAFEDFEKEPIESDTGYDKGAESLSH